MRISVLTPPTRRRLWILLLLAVLVFVIGCGAWVVGFGKLQALQADADQAIAAAQAKTRPIMSADELETRYEAGRQSYANKDYAQAVDSLVQVMAYKPDYKSGLAYLFLSYTALADTQATDPVKLNVAPQTYASALSLARNDGPQLKQQFGQAPQMLPTGSTTYDLLAQHIQQKHDIADAYARGNQAPTAQVGWWDGAISQWETVYQQDPNYLKEYPSLWVSARLVDSYQSKATYVCQVTGDYVQAAQAVNRAIELGRISQLPAIKQNALQTLLRSITQTRCQV